MRKWMALMLWTMLLPMVSSSGCHHRDDSPPSPNRPAITATSIDPQQLRFSGGDVTIAASVYSDTWIHAVVATIDGPGSTDSAPLQSSGGRYETVYTVPANTGNTQARYTVTIIATNSAGQTSATPGAITVQPANALPQPPDEPDAW